MISCIEEIQVFVEKNYYKHYQILRNHNPNETLRVIYKNVVRDNGDKRLFNFCNRAMFLLTLDEINLIYSLNVKDVSNVRPKCFCNQIS